LWERAATYGDGGGRRSCLLTEVLLLLLLLTDGFCWLLIAAADVDSG
jgi:hypothetical protein